MRSACRSALVVAATAALVVLGTCASVLVALGEGEP